MYRYSTYGGSEANVEMAVEKMDQGKNGESGRGMRGKDIKGGRGRGGEEQDRARPSNQ